MLEHSDAAGVALTPQELAFGNINIGTPSNLTSAGFPATVTLMNAGTEPLTVTSIAVSGTDFHETNNCVGIVPGGGGRCTINVTFTPTVLVAETEDLSINDNATGTPHVVTLTGTGINATTTVLFTPNDLVFTARTINTTSPPQKVIMTNSGEYGQVALTITNITTTGDFAVTSNTCPVSPATLGVNQSCTIFVTFTPTSTGTDTGRLVVSDNVGSGTSGISLVGTGNPPFNLTSNTLAQNLLIGTTTTTFTISLLAPSTFTDTITLSCGSGATCAFSSLTIALGQAPSILPSSTLTLSGLTSSTSNPYIFTVSGLDTTTGTATATLNLTIYLEDFGLSASPAVNSVQSGGSVIYTATVSPINGFNQPVALGCVSTSLPQGATCLANPAAITPNGGAVTSQLTVSTTAQSTAVSGLLPRARPRIPPGPMMMLVLWGASNLMALSALLLRRKTGLRGTGRRRRLVFAQMAFATLVLATAFWMSCDTSIYTNVIQPTSVNGTPTGNYVIIIKGTFTGTTSNINGIQGAATTVTHTTPVNLTVQ
jgi:hypothetical protein